MPKKIYALVPSERKKECDHKGLGAWSGKMPCTGKYKCIMCRTELDSYTNKPLIITKDNIMAESNEEVRDTDKDIFMEIRGIIDGVLDSGSTDYITALGSIASIIKDNEIVKAV